MKFCFQEAAIHQRVLTTYCRRSQIGKAAAQRSASAAARSAVSCMPLLGAVAPIPRFSPGQVQGAQDHGKTQTAGNRGPLLRALHALLWFHLPEVLDDFELAAPRLSDIHVHSDVMLSGHHLSRTAGTQRDLRVVQCLDELVLV